MSLRATLDAELKELSDNLITMGTSIEKSIDDTIRALVQQDAGLAKRIIEGDEVFDAMEVTIENKSVAIISTQQPVASDLRKIFATLKIVTDLERIADHCCDISKITIKLAGEDYHKPLIDIPKMGALVRNMIRMTVDCFIESDVIQARLICASDDAIDDYYRLVIEDVTQMIKTDPSTTEQMLKLLMIAKYFERMADHATNIAEWVIYSVEGKHYNTHGTELKPQIED